MRGAAMLAAALLIGGCNLADRQRNAAVNEADVQVSNETAAASAPDENAVAPDDGENAQLAAAPPPRDPSGVDRAWFAGLWTDTGDCADAGQFGRDGRYRLTDGTRGMWNVRAGQLVIENAGGRRVIRVRKIADDTVETIGAGGQTSRSTRCARITPRKAPEPEPAVTLPTPPAPLAPPPPADLVD